MNATYFSSVNNYDTREMIVRFNESVCKAAKEAREDEMCKKIEENVTTKLAVQFNSKWAQKEATLKNELAMEKTACKRERKKDQSKIDRI